MMVIKIDSIINQNIYIYNKNAYTCTYIYLYNKLCSINIYSEEVETPNFKSSNFK